MSNGNEEKSFWTTGTRIIAGTATILTAIVGLIVALNAPPSSLDDTTSPLPNNFPSAFIDSINPCPALEGQSVTFTCHGSDQDSDDYITEYRWESSIDGFLSNQKTFSISSLTSGSHEIILRVKDNHGQWSTEVTRNLNVETPTPTPLNNPPVAVIDSINPSPALEGQSIIFKCHGNDPDSDDYITEYRWESSIDGLLSDQKDFFTSSLTSGSHLIILQVKDSHGQWSTEVTRNLRVDTPTPTPTPTPLNNPPDAFVDSINPSPALEGQSVTFTCHGNDPDSDDYITEYRWESSIDGLLSDQKTFSTSSLTSGSHEIILRVKDNHGQWSTEVTRNLLVEEIKIPSAEIKKIWFEDNYYDLESNSIGMLIHASFDIYNLKGEDCRSNAYFYFEDGTPLYDFNGEYRTTGGEVAAWEDFEPLYEATSFNDLEIYLPYNELHMATGAYNLKFFITIRYEAELDRSNWVYFSYTQL